MEKLKKHLEKSFHEEVFQEIIKGYVSGVVSHLEIKVGEKNTQIIIDENENEVTVYLLNSGSEELKEKIKEFYSKKTNVVLKQGEELSIGLLNLPMRAYTCLLGYMDSPVRNTLGEIISVSARELEYEHRQIGRKATSDIVTVIEGLGYQMKQEV